VGSLDTPVVTACVPLLVDEKHLETVNGMVNGVQFLSNLVAPIVGGVLYGIVGAKAMIGGSCAFFLVASFAEAFIQVPFVKRQWEGGVVRSLAVDMKSGLNFVRRNKVIMRMIIIAALLNMVLMPLFFVGAPVIFRIVLGVNDQLYGVGMSLISLASIMGALLAGKLTKLLRLNNLYTVFVGASVLLALMAVGLLFFGGNSGLIVFFVTGLPVGMALSVVSIYAISMIQRVSPGNMMGKVMSIVVAVCQCAVPLGQAMFGLLFNEKSGSAFGPVMLVAVVTLLIAAVGWLLLRGFDENSVQQVQAAVE
jgi:MFS family permease